jgi:hypothetical protein
MGLISLTISIEKMCTYCCLLIFLHNFWTSFYGLCMLTEVIIYVFFVIMCECTRSTLGAFVCFDEEWKLVLPTFKVTLQHDLWMAEIKTNVCFKIWNRNKELRQTVDRLKQFRAHRSHFYFPFCRFSVYVQWVNRISVWPDWAKYCHVEINWPNIYL